MEGNNSSTSSLSLDISPMNYANVRERREMYKQRSFKITCENLEEVTEASDAEGGISKSSKYIPVDYDIVAKYDKISTLYELPLSPSVISLTEEKETGKKVVKKTLQKSKLVTEEQMKAAELECAIHSHMSHPNIIKLFSYSENETEYALLMEYANKATYLQELIFDQHTPVESEKEIQVYAMDLLEALKHIHGQGVIHCDLKLDNMLAHQEEDDTFPIIKICDFGLAHKIDPNLGSKALKKTTVGTWGYIAPESHKNKYIGREMDMWSLGLTLYEMAVAYKPTQVKGYEYGKGDLPFRPRDWRGRSKELQDLILACMEMDPEKRITAEDALQHPYFSTEV